MIFRNMLTMKTEEVKSMIQQEIAKTEAIIREYKESTQPVSPDDAIGRISRMDAINNKSVTESTLRRAKEKLSKLQHILSRVGRSDFGVCAKCKQTIPLGRIIIKPESIYCVKCAG